jgi:Membrane-bound metallopeptidase
MHCSKSPTVRRISLVFVLVAMLGWSSAHSENPRNADLERVRGEIVRLRKRLEDVHAQTASTQRALQEVELELDIRDRELQIAVNLQSQIEREQAAAQAQVSELGPRIQRQKQFLRKRLDALYRMGGLSYVRMLMSLDDRRDPVEAMSMLSYLVSRDSRAVTRFQASQETLRLRLLDLADRGRRLAQMRQVVEQRRQAVVATRNQQQRMLDSLRGEGSQSQRQLTELQEKAKRLEHLLDVLARQRAGTAAATDIRAFQGALNWPAEGKVFEHFGVQRNAKFSTVTFNNGLKIAAAPGTEVHAVFAGTVLFSQWFKGYGNLIILDHGNRIFSLYGNLKSPTVSPGDHVLAGQALAGVGESEDARSGYLYFEIRQDNKPEDPQKWLR